MVNINNFTNVYQNKSREDVQVTSSVRRSNDKERLIKQQKDSKQIRDSMLHQIFECNHGHGLLDGEKVEENDHHCHKHFNIKDLLDEADLQASKGK